MDSLNVSGGPRVEATRDIAPSGATPSLDGTSTAPTLGTDAVSFSAPDHAIAHELQQTVDLVMGWLNGPVVAAGK